MNKIARWVVFVLSFSFSLVSDTISRRLLRC